MKHKKLFISLTAVFSVIIFFTIFLLIWYVGDSYKDFERFRKEFEIPGLDDGAIPQGMGTYSVEVYFTNDEGKTEAKTVRHYFISAYMNDGSPSRIYVVSEDTDETGENKVTKVEGYVTIKKENGADFYGHCGGIATNGSHLWVTGESHVYVATASSDYVSAKKNIAQEIVEKAKRIKLSEDVSDEDYDFSVQFTTSFKANCNASFCYYFDDPRYSGLTYDRLYVGEFYRDGNYPTDKSHWVTTSNGYENRAFMYEYSISSSNKYGLSMISGEGINEDNQVPKIQKIFSLPEKIQGVAWSGRSGYGMTDGMLILSESYGLANSHILCFNYEKVAASSNRSTYLSLTGNSFEYDGVSKVIGGKEMPYTDSTLYVYYVDKTSEELLVKDYSIPCMSEGLCVVTETTSGHTEVNRVLVLFESASKKYNLFVRERLYNVYSFIPREL